MNIGERYVLTIADVFKGAESGKDKARVSGFDNLIFDDNGLGKLEKLEDVLQEACDNARREGYGEGLNAAWECARKIIPLWGKGKTADIFGTRDIENIFKGYFASDAISKIKEYEEEQNDDEVKAGDEMVTYDGNKPVTIIVTYVSRDGHIDGIDSEGMGYTHRYLANWTKTGRHFPQIAETLKRIKGD